jgi:muramoyltetrapeptide carboxypeptidase LdcA involved in peptidoglycan recycling
MELIPARKARPGDRIAVLSPSFEGGVLLLESSEELIPAREFGRIVRCLGERGLLQAVDAVVVGPPFGHTRPQWIVPYGGLMTIDGVARRVLADYR